MRQGVNDGSLHPSSSRSSGGNHQRVCINSLVHEPLIIATLARLTSVDVDVSFYDARLELISYNPHPDSPLEKHSISR